MNASHWRQKQTIFLAPLIPVLGAIGIHVVGLLGRRKSSYIHSYKQIFNFWAPFIYSRIY